MRRSLLASAALVPLLLSACSQAGSAPSAQPASSAPAPSSSSDGQTLLEEPEPSASPTSLEDLPQRSVGETSIIEVGEAQLNQDDLPSGYTRYAEANQEANAYGSRAILDCLGMPIGVGDSAEVKLRGTSASPVYANEGADVRVTSAQAVFEDVSDSIEFFGLVLSDYPDCFDEQLESQGAPASTEVLEDVEDVSYPEGIYVAAYRTESETRSDSGGTVPIFVDTVFMQAGEVQTMFYVYSEDSPVQVDDVQSLVDTVVDRLDEVTR